MRMYFSLAWRNIWRNKRRSFISIASVLLAVVLAVLTRSFQLGFYSHSINNVVSYYTGYVQIHAPGYWDNQSLDRSLGDWHSLADVVDTMRYVTITSPRLESFALISAGNITDVAMVSGIDPDRENRMTRLADKVVSGHYLQPGSDGILLGEGLARHLQLGVGDTVIVLGQGYHGITAAGRFPITGIVKFPTSEQNNSTSYLTLEQAQNLSGAYGRITSLAMMIDGERHLNSVMSELHHAFDDKYEIMTWKQMMPELVEYIETDNASGLIMIFVIYMVIGFGILGTILMMTLERTHEFGMLMAVGMKRLILGTVTVIESIMLSFVGVIGGALLSIPIMLYFHAHPIHLSGSLAEATAAYGFEPIFPVSLDPMIFIWQAVTILIIALIADVYPLWRISRLSAVKAMRHA